MRRLIDIENEQAKELLGDYYIVSKSRMENLIACYESGARKIIALAEMVKSQQAEIESLAKQLTEID